MFSFGRFSRSDALVDFLHDRVIGYVDIKKNIDKGLVDSGMGFIETRSE